jgi:hypothetical protein
MFKTIGIDIGSKGALALLSPTGELLEIEGMPILRDGPGNRPNDNAPLLAEIARVKDDGRAEASLIAVAGLLRKGGALSDTPNPISPSRRWRGVF